MGDLAEVRAWLLAEAEVDYLELWWVIRQVRLGLGSADAETVRAATLRLLADLLGTGVLVAGQATRVGGFEPWPVAPAAALRRIEQEWRALGREPTLGDVCWFNQGVSFPS